MAAWWKEIRVSSLFNQLTQSQFFMWRTVFALVHADGVVTREELQFMVDVLDDMPFTQHQRDVLKEDIAIPQDPAAMFQNVTEARDQATFFQFAHALVWIDGDYGTEEQDVMLRLKQLHIQSADLDTLLESDTGLELDVPQKQRFQNLRKDIPDGPKPERLHALLHSFKARFLTQE